MTPPCNGITVTANTQAALSPIALFLHADLVVKIVMIGLLQAFGILVFPKITLVLVFLLMALVLVVRPWGLLGKPDAGHGRVVLSEGILGLARYGRTGKMVAAAVPPISASAPMEPDCW